MLKAPFKRIGTFDAIPKAIRDKCKKDHCACCAAPYLLAVGADNSPERRLILVHNRTEHLHHIFSRRWIRALELDPHTTWNLVSLCAEDHGKAKKAEERLWRGDGFGFIQAMKQMNFPMELVKYAAEQYGLKEVLSWL